MVRNLAMAIMGAWVILMAGCNSTDGGGTELTAEEKLIVGTWVGDMRSAKVTMVLKEDHTQSNLTLLDAKPYWKSEGTWSVSGDLVTQVNAKCQMVDGTGTLKDTPCSGAAVSDTTRIKVSGDKWTVNSNGSNHQDVVFTKQ
jgi:hypothetical protein